MARKLRVQFPGAIYYLMNRGDHQEAIFHDDTDRELFLSTLTEVCGKAAWQIQALCLMRDYFHMVMETPLPNLVNGMKWFLGTYSARFNRRRKFTGHVFSGRYKSLLVGGEGGSLRAACDYVHLDPARTKLLEADQPLRSYPWSSFPLYLLPASQRPGWLKVEKVLAEWGISQDTPSGRQLFEQGLEARRAQEQQDELQPSRPGWWLDRKKLQESPLEAIGKEPASHHHGHAVQQSAEERANRIVEAELRNVGWTERELVETRKGDVRKLHIARRLRSGTTMTLKWIADRLHMGASTHLSHLLYWEKRRKSEQSKSSACRDATCGIPERLETDPSIESRNEHEGSSILWTDPELFDPTFD